MPENPVTEDSRSGNEKPTYPFEVELIYPEGYIQNGNEILVQLRLKPDQNGETAVLKTECFDGIDVNIDKLLEIHNLNKDQYTIVDIGIKMAGANRGKMECSLEVFDQERVKKYSFKRELFIISTDDGKLCSSADDYDGLLLKHINKLKYEGRISDDEYENLKKEIMRGGAVIESN